MKTRSKTFRSRHWSCSVKKFFLQNISGLLLLTILNQNYCTDYTFSANSSSNKSFNHDHIMWMLIDGKAIELLTYLTILILYIIIKIQLKAKVWNFRSSRWRCSKKKVFLKISQNSQKNVCARVSFLRKSCRPQAKKGLWHRCFPVSFAKFSRTPFFTKHLRATASETLLFNLADFFSPKKVLL